VSEASGRGSPLHAPPAAAAAAAGPSAASRAGQGRGDRGRGARDPGRQLRCPAAGSRYQAVDVGSHRPSRRGAPRRPGCRGALAVPSACTQPTRARPGDAMQSLPPRTSAPARAELRGGAVSGSGGGAFRSPRGPLGISPGGDDPSGWPSGIMLGREISNFAGEDQKWS
jgi:hypothetical protein